MKNLFTAFILVTSLAGILPAQTSSQGPQRTGGSGKTRIAVVEFTPGPNAPGMTAEGKRQLQSSIAFSLFESRRFDVVDVRNTRAATQAELSAINSGSTIAAVRVGKLLGVNYVLTGTVVEYDIRGGQVTMQTRLVEVATGKVKYSGETTGQSTSAMTARAGAAEMMSKVLKPAIEKLTARLTGV
jgi:curli biogenesis system outer membrane secretion channel CsgG